MTVLRLWPAYGDALDRAAAAVEVLELVRRPDGCYARPRPQDVGALVRALAYAGIGASEVEIGPDSAGQDVPATSGDLRPVPAALAVRDTVRVRRLALGPATALVLRRRLARFRAPSPAAQARCRTLLSGEDALLAWRRRAWVERPHLRAVRRLSSLRPVIFDRADAGGAARERHVFSSAGELARWAFG